MCPAELVHHALQLIDANIKMKQLSIATNYLATSYGCEHQRVSRYDTRFEKCKRKKEHFSKLVRGLRVKVLEKSFKKWF